MRRTLMDLLIVIINTFCFAKISGITKWGWGWILIPFILEVVVLHITRGEEE